MPIGQWAVDVAVAQRAKKFDVAADMMSFLGIGRLVISGRRSCVQIEGNLRTIRRAELFDESSSMTGAKRNPVRARKTVQTVAEFPKRAIGLPLNSIPHSKQNTGW
jgi:hypothetical protein